MIGRHFIKNFFVSIWVTSLFLALLSPAHAATNGRFRFDGLPSGLTSTCDYSIDIIVETGGDSSNAADIQVNFDPTKIEILDSDSSESGKQIKEGSAYEGYFGNEVDEGIGRIRLVGASLSGTFSGQATFASIEFRSKAGAANGGFTIDFDGIGETLDSNIADSNTSADILGSVQNISFTFSPGTCVVDNLGPEITFIAPQGNFSDYPSDGNVFIKITDNGTGVSLGTLSININGDIYTSSSPQVTCTGGPAEYNCEIDPINDFPDDSPTTIIVSVQDAAGNTTSQSIIFNIPPGTEGLPSTGIDLPILDTPVGESVINTAEDIGDAYNTITEIIPGAVGEIIRDAGFAGIGSILSSLTLTAYAIALLFTLRSPRNLFYLIGFLFKKRTKNPWGVILDGKTNKPVAFANVRLYLEGSKAVVSEKVSDLQGRYGLVASGGEYRLEVEHSDYEKEVIQITIPETGAINKDIVLRPKMAKLGLLNTVRKISDSINATINKYLSYIFVIGLFSAILASIFNPVLTNFVIAGTYVVLIAIQIFTEGLRIKEWGSVFDSTSNLLIPNTLVKIFDTKNWKLLDTQMTDEKGRFGLFVEPGEYALLAIAQGYRFPSKKQKDLPVMVEKYQSLLKLDIKQGKKLDADIFLDPAGTETIGEKFEKEKANQGGKAGSTFSSPFGHN